jgi:hypothetical protein
MHISLLAAAAVALAAAVGIALLLPRNASASEPEAAPTVDELSPAAALG